MLDLPGSPKPLDKYLILTYEKLALQCFGLLPIGELADPDLQELSVYLVSEILLGCCLHPAVLGDLEVLLAPLSPEPLHHFRLCFDLNQLGARLDLFLP